MTWDGGTTWDSGTTWDQSLSVPPPPPPPWPPTPSPYKRQAWLTLGDRQLSLDDLTAGYVCVNLDLGYPGVREVMDSRADRDGSVDLTSLMGPRAVTADIEGWDEHEAGGMTRDQIARLFGPYIVPRVRPVLHYTLDDPTDPAERIINLRASNFSAPKSPNAVQAVQLAWVASDPIIYSGGDPHIAIARPGGLRTGGLVFPTDQDVPNGPSGVRTYPTDGMPFRFASATGTGTNVNLVTAGDTDVYPILQIIGRITAPQVTITNYFDSGQMSTGIVGFRSSYTVDVSRSVTIDTSARTITADDGTRLESQIATWGQSFPVIVPGALNQLSLSGSSIDGMAQVVATWRDGWIET